MPSCRLDLARSAGVRHSLEAIIAALRHSLDAIERAIAQAIADDPPLAELNRLLQTIFGVGPVVAATLIAELPELGRPPVRQTDRRASRSGTAHPAERQDPLAREHWSWPPWCAPRPVQRCPQRHCPSLALQGLLQSAGHPEWPAWQGRAGRRDAQNPDPRQRPRPPGPGAQQHKISQTPPRPAGSRPKPHPVQWRRPPPAPDAL